MSDLQPFLYAERHFAISDTPFALGYEAVTGPDVTKRAFPIRQNLKASTKAQIAARARIASFSTGNVDQFLANFPRATPRSLYQGERVAYRGVGWGTHVIDGIVPGLRDLDDSSLACSESISACFRLSAYGAPKHWVYISGRLIQTEHPNAIHVNGLSDVEIADMTERRFVVFLCHENAHFTAVVVDQWAHEVWYFDAYATGRTQRFKRTIDSWVRVTQQMHYQSKWDCIAAPMTSQFCGHTCGWIVAQAVENFVFVRDPGWAKPSHHDNRGIEVEVSINGWDDWTVGVQKTKRGRYGWETALLDLWRGRFLADLGLPPTEPAMAVNKSAKTTKESGTIDFTATSLPSPTVAVPQKKIVKFATPPPPSPGSGTVAPDTQGTDPATPVGRGTQRPSSPDSGAFYQGEDDQWSPTSVTTQDPIMSSPATPSTGPPVPTRAKRRANQMVPNRGGLHPTAKRPRRSQSPPQVKTPPARRARSASVASDQSSRHCSPTNYRITPPWRKDQREPPKKTVDQAKTREERMKERERRRQAEEW